MIKVQCTVESYYAENKPITKSEAPSTQKGINPYATNVIYIYMEHLFLMFLDHTRRRTTVGRTPLDE